MLGLIVNCTDAALFHNYTRIHHIDPIAQLANHSQIVGNKNQRKSEFLLQTRDQLKNLCLRGNIQRCGRFVTDHQLGVSRQRHCNHNTLVHSAGQFKGILIIPQLGLIDTHTLQHTDTLGFQFCLCIFPVIDIKRFFDFLCAVKLLDLLFCISKGNTHQFYAVQLLKLTQLHLCRDFCGFLFCDQGIGHLLADSNDGIDSGRGILRNIGDLCAANAHHFLFCSAQ